MLNSTHLSLSHFGLYEWGDGTRICLQLLRLFQMRTMRTDSEREEGDAVDKGLTTVLEYGTGLRVASQHAPLPNLMRKFGDHDRRIHKLRSQISDLTSHISHLRSERFAADANSLS